MRKAIKKPLTTRALELLIRNLNKLTNLEEEKIAILNQSIEHCWQTVYPLKNKQESIIEKENIYENELTYSEKDFTKEQYARLMRGQMPKEELIKILEEKNAR